jgi:F0F1-type ATP synthase assembly protein I
MPNDDRDKLDRSIETMRATVEGLQSTVQKAGPAASISYSLIGAIGVMTIAGYGLDRWLGTWPWCLVGGMLFGVATGFYLLAKEVWRK